MNQGIIIIAALGVAAVCCGLYFKSKKTNKKPILTPENVEQIEMSDIVGYFKSLNLIKGQDKPFIAQGDEVLKLVEFQNPIPEKSIMLLLGVYGSDYEIKHLKALCCNVLDDSVKEVLGSDTLVVLS
ncbi:MAG: hypothetical protein HDR85_06790 [Bacteroides sp.]|nr:hypothetical protein [Bacteroides sp.]MDE6824862.1 hypothetical protein [Duncaniella sp.]